LGGGKSEIKEENGDLHEGCRQREQQFGYPDAKIDGTHVFSWDVGDMATPAVFCTDACVDCQPDANKLPAEREE
jgi:hypothetical protein